MIELKLAPFYPVLDTALWARLGMAIADAAEAILDGGARILQFRHKGHYSRRIIGEAKDIRRMCASAGAMFVIDDRADMAALLHAALHVGQDDLSPGDARKLLPAGLVLGLSTHNETQLRDAAGEPADYLAIGPIFQTASKENPDPALGLNELQRLRPLTARPLVAIGGITRQSAAAVWKAGADSVAVIGDLAPREVTRKSVRARTEEWLQLHKI